MKRFFITILALCFTLPAFGQLAMRSDRAQTVQGGVVRPLPGAYIKVCTFAEDKSCGQTVSIYSDPQGTKPLANPFRANNQGDYQYFFLSTQNLVERVTYPGGPSYAQYISSSQTAVSSVAGKTGEVMLSSSDLTDDAFIAKLNAGNTFLQPQTFSNGLDVNNAGITNAGAISGAASVNGVIFADKQNGADACAKIAAAIAASPSKVVDARGITGDQLCTNPVAWSNGGVGAEVWLGDVNLKLTNTLVIGTNVVVKGWSQSYIMADSTFNSTFTNYAGTSRPALVVLGKQSEEWSPKSLLDGVWVDCANVVGCIGVYSENIQENGGLRDTTILRWSTHAVWFERTTNGSTYRTPQNYLIEGLWVLSQRTGDAYADGVIYISGGGDQNFRWLSDITLDIGGSVQAGSVGIKLAAGSRGKITGVHCEELETCIIPSSGSSVDTADSYSAGATVVSIPTGLSEITLNNISRLGTTTNTIVATDCGLTLTSTSISFFYVGGGTDKPCTYSKTDTGVAVVAQRVALDTTGFNLLRSNKAILSSDYTTSADTNLHTIVTMTLPPNNATSYSFQCSGAYSQATAAGGVKFGVWASTFAPTNVFAIGTVQTASTAHTSGVLATLATTTATNVVTATPEAIATDYSVRISGTIELPSNGNAEAFKIMVGTANAGNLITVRRGFQCQVF